MPAEFLGRGWKFPIDLDRDGHVAVSQGEQKVQESIIALLGTARGERVMRPTFGSRLRELLFSPIDASTRSLIAHYVAEALVTWEPRIDVLRVDAEEEARGTGKVLVNVEYRVRATNSVFNLVYPFYLREGVGAAAR